MRLFILLLVFATILSVKKDSYCQIKETVRQIMPGSDNPRNSEGDFIQLRDGRILFIYSHFYGDVSNDDAPSYLAGIFSDDEGNTWSTESIEVLPNEGRMNIMSVTLLRLNNGDIALFYLRKNSKSDCIPLMRVSKDEAKTWSDPITCITDRPGYYVLNNDRVVQLKNGRLLMPVALHNTPQGTWSSTAEIYCYYSDDNGTTWKCSKEVPNPKGVMLQEPGIVELKDGRLLMFTRTNAGYQYFSYSSNHGKKWTEVKAGNLVSPVSPATIERVPSTGELVAIWNNNLSEDEQRAKYRTPLTIGLSRDEGKSWENLKNLEDDPNGWYCYTAVYFIGEKMLLGYCAGDRETSRLDNTSIVLVDLER